VTEVQKGPLGQRRGRGARERILNAAQRLFREQGINNTGMNQLCEVAQVSKHTAYQHFAGKDELIAAYLRWLDSDAMLDSVFGRTDLTPRERLLAVFERPLALEHGQTATEPTPGGAGSTPIDDNTCPFINAAIEITDPEHPARAIARDYKRDVAARLTETARQAGATDPELLGEQLALLLDGASARTRTLSTDALPTAVGIAATLIEHAIPETTSARP